jgi:cell division protein FtsL
MKGFTTFLFVVAFFVGIYYGFIFLVSKTMKSQPKTNISEKTSQWQSQSQRNRNLQDEQRELMRQRQERMRDLGHR